MQNGKKFTPGFFNVMQDLLVHLPWEALVGGPVQFRWMYPAERELKKLMSMVCNKARVEAYIAETFAIKEISNFSSKYFVENHNVNAPSMRYHTILEPPNSELEIFKWKGKSVGASSHHHTEEVQQYFLVFDKEYWKSSRQPTQKQLDNLCLRGSKHAQFFVLWLYQYAMNCEEIPHDLRQLSSGDVMATNLSQYDINGFHFRTAKLEASCPLATTCNNGAVTTASDANENTLEYYGVIQNIIEYTFGGPKVLKVVFFDCLWFDPRNGTCVDEFGLVEVKHNSRLQGQHSNIMLAHQVQQVYYMPYPHPSMKSLWVACKVNPHLYPPNDVNELQSNTGDDVADVYQEDVGDDFPISGEAGLNQLDRDVMELIDEELGPSSRKRRRSLRIQ
ncbi:hypothetical protein U9M48_019502 [Paspalum notatum var. saurae]|uniref:DUF4216 domain-containing protein n=1 Tax=Paspalum notatum var. saurae TaxID=547442 RepID=A0AAQ3TFI1_PASNO